MKRFLLFLSALFIATAAIAHTINWYVDENVYHTTTCESGDNVTPPTAPEKYGYTFQGWKEYYIPIGYLESTGPQYIDTGIRINVNTNFIIKFADSPAWIIGASVSLMCNANDFGIAVERVRFGTVCTTSVSFATGIHVVQVNKLWYSVNGIRTYWNNTPEVTPNKLCLFRPCSGSGVVNKGKIYYVKIYDNDVLVRDFIPVLDKDGTPCMYDKVEHKLYYNAGTGDFIAGPIIGE